MCNSIACPNGHEHIDDAWEVECHYGECEVEQCCGATCASHPCPNNYTPIEHAAQIFCTDDVCTTGQCCDSTVKNLPKINPYEFTYEFTCILLGGLVSLLLLLVATYCICSY